MRTARVNCDRRVWVRVRRFACRAMRPRINLVLYDDRGIPALEIRLSTLQASGAVNGAECTCLTVWESSRGAQPREDVGEPLA